MSLRILSYILRLIIVSDFSATTVGTHTDYKKITEQKLVTHLIRIWAQLLHKVIVEPTLLPKQMLIKTEAFPVFINIIYNVACLHLISSTVSIVNMFNYFQLK